MTAPAGRSKPPHNVNVLGRWLTESANQTGIAAGRLRRSIGFMIVAAMLDNARHPGDAAPLFLVKGGVAMELRLGRAARATKDLDTALRAPTAELATHLDPALRSGFGDFSATRTELEPVRDTGAVRCDIKVAYRNRPVVTVPLEVAEAEASIGDEIDDVAATTLSFVGLDGPETVPCITVRWQIAQKLHAVTDQPVDRVNDRFRDLLDLQLLEDLVDAASWRDVRTACLEVFEGRAQHGWPPQVAIHSGWADGYRRLADEIDFGVSDIEEAADAVRTLIEKIHATD